MGANNHKMEVIRIITRDGKTNTNGAFGLTYMGRSYDVLECAWFALEIHIFHMFVVGLDGVIIEFPDMLTTGEGSVFQTHLLPDPSNPKKGISSSTMSAMIRLFRDYVGGDYQALQKLQHLGKHAK
jgi:hypothetical protein